MKVTIISPEFPNKGGFPLAPPVLEYLGGLTRMHAPDAEIELLDANREPNCTKNTSPTCAKT